MAEAALIIFSTSLTASAWAILGGFTWMLVFYCVIPMIAKWNTFGLMSPQAAARAATLRTVAQLRPATAAPHWS